jgi:hypothetical protein
MTASPCDCSRVGMSGAVTFTRSSPYSKHQILASLGFDPELMEVAVEPPHGILNGNVQVPESICGRNLDSTPDRRMGFLERDFELVDHLWRQRTPPSVL